MANGKPKPVYITKEGLLALQEELDYLRTEGRADVAQKIGDAKADGDISENAGYDEAKNQQAFLEGRIMDLERKVKYAVIIENQDSPSDQVGLGRSVTIREVGYSDDETYMIVGSAEANPSNGRISNESPMGQSLMEKRVGDTVAVDTPGGQLEFEIVGIN
ncbi:MAG: transcription elongation factor GreA [Chloroflexota bacterium]|nr:transcription elongation factor GreA [Chloroflexota bacterium]